MLMTVTLGKRKQSSRWYLNLKKNVNDDELTAFPK